MPLANEAVLAAAGSGKTKRLIDEALSDRETKVLIVTYTRENRSEIDARLWETAGGEPHNVTVMSWYEFLLRDGVKPYQSYMTEILSVRSINFETQRSWYAKKSVFKQYYLDSAGNLYKDGVADLVCALDDASGGKPVARLAQCYDVILIDELQDLAGYDLDLLLRLLKSPIRILTVGDPRQSVFVTNTSTRNKSVRRAAIVDWIEAQDKAGLLELATLVDSYRCNQAICDYADAMFPEFPTTVSKNVEVVKDRGVYLVHVDQLDAYRAAYYPQELRWNKADKLAGAGALNLGEVKGMTFDRVMIHPTSTITDYIEASADLKPGTRAKFYVGVTRARHSVAIVTSSKVTNSALRFWPQASIS